jgi:tripartite-type tricarboxylate transporter receptor subunit TctC
MRTNVSRSVAALLSAACLVAAWPASAETYPARPVRAVVPYAAGGVVDAAARIFAERLSPLLGQGVVIENRTGASGTLGVDYVTKAEPDGYTLLICSADFMTTTVLMPKMSFDPYKELAPVSMLATAPMLLVASEASGFKTLADVLAAAKAGPERVAYSSPGVGQINHLGGEWIGLAGGVKMLHVPYRGGAPAATAVAAGDVQLGVLGVPAVLPLVHAGKARVLGVLSKEKRSFLKDFPTIAEAGMPEVEVSVRVGLFAPKGTPAAIVTRLHAEAQKVLADPHVRERLNAVGLDADPLGPEAFIARVRADAAAYAPVIERTGMKMAQ